MQLVKAQAVAGAERDVVFAGKSPIAVHDDGHVRRNLPGLEDLQESVDATCCCRASGADAGLHAMNTKGARRRGDANMKSTHSSPLTPPARSMG